jgi:hypothetical protein
MDRTSLPAAPRPAPYGGTSYAATRRGYRRLHCDSSCGPCQPGVRRVASASRRASSWCAPRSAPRRCLTTSPSLWPGVLVGPCPALDEASRLDNQRAVSAVLPSQSFTTTSQHRNSRDIAWPKTGEVGGLVRKVGWVLVGLGSLGAVACYYVAYSADTWSDATELGIDGAVAALSLAIVGLLLIQFRS